jgi:hypothetical protein
MPLLMHWLDAVGSDSQAIMALAQALDRVVQLRFRPLENRPRHNPPDSDSDSDSDSEFALPANRVTVCGAVCPDY